MRSATTTTTTTLKVPGATLYYEVRGTGPVLLLICGGIYDAAGYSALARDLADRYTVVTYDRRGNSRSPLDGPPEPQSVEVHADDAYQVLRAVGVGSAQPAYVFGNSSGALIGLELAARHPELVGVLVAHEPPIFDLLPDRDDFFALVHRVRDAFHTGGSGAAMGVFAAGMQMRGGEQDGQPPADDPETTAMMARMGANMAFFIGYEVPGFAGWTPDLAALTASSVRVVAAVGEDSAGEPPHRAGVALAERMGSQAAVFPGDHGGFGAQHEAFATRLHATLLT